MGAHSRPLAVRKILLFLKKKKQKDFCLFACVAQFQRFGIAPRRQIDKSFLLLFYKKEVLSFY
jgi:hypothetical protein